MKILYISRSKLGHSVNAVYIKGLRANNVDVRELFISRNEYFDLIRYLFKYRNTFDTILVGYDSPFLVYLAKLFSNKKVVYNALCSVYERMIVSRALAKPISIKGAYYWLSDFLAVHSADLIMVETNEQARYFKKLFFVPESKLFRAWTGVEDGNFYHQSDIDKTSAFTVIFRGQFVPESGIEYALKAAKILEKENINFIIHGGGPNADQVKKNIEESGLKNVQLITDFLPAENLRSTIQKCHLLIGHLSDHPRLRRTIPHKCYESLAMQMPYLTANHKGVSELLKGGETCIFCEPGNSQSLAEKILWAKNNPTELEKIAQNGYRLYDQSLRPEILSRELLQRLI